MIDQRQVLDSLFDGLYFVTRERKITYWNRAAEKISGYSAAEMVGIHCYDSPLKHIDSEGNDLCRDGCPLSWAIAHRCKHEDEIFLHHRDGHRVPVNVRVAPVFDGAGQVAGASELFRDSTPTGVIAARIAELEELAMLDPLTQLANEKYISEQVDQHLHEMKRHPIKAGVILFKIDNFDAVVDSHGSASSTQLQKIAGQTLKYNCRPLDLIARIDEGVFLGLFRNVTSNMLHATSEKMRLLFAKSYFSVENVLIKGTLSAGGHCLKDDDTYDKVLSICTKLTDSCQQQGGNRSSVDIRLVYS